MIFNLIIIIIESHAGSCNEMLFRNSAIQLEICDLVRR